MIVLPLQVNMGLSFSFFLLVFVFLPLGLTRSALSSNEKRIFIIVLQWRVSFYISFSLSKYLSNYALSKCILYSQFRCLSFILSFSHFLTLLVVLSLLFLTQSFFKSFFRSLSPTQSLFQTFFPSLSPLRHSFSHPVTLFLPLSHSLGRPFPLFL